MSYTTPLTRGVFVLREVPGLLIQKYYLDGFCAIPILSLGYSTMPTNRINIILSDDLAERLERVKETLDVSYVCEHSLNAAVTTEESKLGILSRREAAIARLKVEAFNECDKWSRKGQRDGLELAPDLS